MATLDSDFEDVAEEALLDDAETRLVGEFDNLVARLIEVIHTELRAYADRHGYEVESTIDSLATPEVDRSGGRIDVLVGWESEQMARWEFGTSAHTIDGDPVLSFVWEDNDKRGDDPPQWVREEFDQARSSDGQFRSGWRVFLPEVTVDGIPESRAIRDGLRAFRQVIES
jgi:hypothetical protein